MSELNSQIKAKDEDSFREIYRFIFTTLRKQYQSGELTIFDPQAAGGLDILSNIVDSEEMREIFITNR
jgi:hypothetical protein